MNYNFRKKCLGVNLFTIKVGRCFLVSSSHASYYVHVNEYFLILVCISLARFYKQGLKQVFKFVKSLEKKINHRGRIYVLIIFLKYYAEYLSE